MNMDHKSLILICFSALFSFGLVDADGVLGCGGFVKSDVEINFSLVEVKLYTPHWSIKYQTDCAPNTGYYLIPLYDKGDFILKVEPPKGWTFEPESVELHVDGDKDKCSLGEDINFVFTGFSLTGKVISKGQSSGPGGVKVKLFKSGSQDVLQTVETGEDGSYQFSKVMPGKYDVRASQDQYKFEKSEVNVEVTTDNTDAGSHLIIAGYSVTGQVFSEGEPIKGVNFLLYSSTVSKNDVKDCDKSRLEGIGNTEEPLCYVTSDSSGKFVFPCIVTGDYQLIPFYKGEHIKFDVKPEKLPFTVEHSSVKLESVFQVAGFSVTGQVLDSIKGSGITNADVILNGKTVTKTGNNGVYHLENMKTGVYKILIKSQHMVFDEQEIKITPNTPQLNDIIPSSFDICGKVTIDKFPEGLSQQITNRKMIIFPEGKGSAAVSKETSDDGNFCTPVKPGKYVVRVHLSDTEVKAGLTIAPAERLVTVTNKPILDVVFSQFRAKVTGTVNCLEKCGQIEVSLDAVGRNDKQITQAQGTQNVATFTFDNVLPGKYKATVMRDSLCWKDKTIEFEVGATDVNNLLFIQTGYILKCTISHPITLNFAHEQKEGSVGSFELNKGKNRFCLQQPGIYKLTPDSCHKFEKEVYTYDTSNPETLTLTAVSHLVYGNVKTEIPVNDLIVTITSSVDQSVKTLGPLNAEKVIGNKTDKDLKGPQEYKFSHWTRSGEKLSVTVKSSEMLYNPPTMDVTIPGDVCPGEMIQFTGERGLFIIGHITPALGDVLVTVYDSEDRVNPVNAVTNEKGDFNIGPLHKGYDYVVKAEKDGYILEKDEDEMAVFKARKLCRINVKIMGEKDEPLSDVLLSLSGGKQYRSNNLTTQDGTMAFLNLSPGQYFLRPMMKEYKFEPSSQMLEVKEGTTMDVSIKGVRTAYSCYGEVTSLNGEPEAGVFVEALGRDDCSQYQEESKTEVNGNYRIRGLQPHCTYEVRLKIGDMNKHIERAAPKSRFVQVENSDFIGVNIIAFRRMNQMDISGNVVTESEYLPTLKVRLYKEDNPGVPMFTAPLGVVSFFYLPSLQMDDSVYFVRLESSLSKNTHEFDQPEIELRANLSYKHLTFKFEPKRKSLEQELSQSSVLMLPLSILVAFAIYNYKKLQPFLQQILGQVFTLVQKSQASVSTQQQQQQSPQQYSAIQEFDLHDSPIARKKKPRKT
ncbi:hypothetical protein ACF0H5_011861 [Mactra antiquata]